MKILGIDTSTVLGAVGIVDGEELVAEMRTNISVTHSERLMLHIDGLLGSARMTLDDIDGFAVSVGPGSFTGLRIGVATAKGLAYATGRPIVGVSSLAALADNLPHSAHRVCPVYDARKGMVYAALYEDAQNTQAGPEGGWERLEVAPPRALTPEGLCDIIDRPTVFIGEGARVYGGFLSERLGDRAIFMPQVYSCNSGGLVALRGLREIMAGGGPEDRFGPMTLAPVYLRAADAEFKKQAPPGGRA